MKITQRGLVRAVLAIGSAAIAMGQAPPAAGKGGPPRPVFSVTSAAFPDGGEIPMKHAVVGANKSPAFQFHWNLGVNPGTAPDGLQSYAVILHNIENSNNRTTTDTLHWAAHNIPGTAAGLPEGLAGGELPDGTKNGPGFARGGSGPVAYIGPGASPGPIHHYMFEFYALDTKLTLPATSTRDDLMKAMDGHVIGKAVYFGRFHLPALPN